MFDPIKDEQAEATVVKAIELGVRNFDTAPHYGLGLSETRFGLALHRMDRNSFFLSTKVGRFLVPNPDSDGKTHG